VTIVGTIGVCVGALAFYPRGEFFVGTLVITAFVFSDLVDGTMARLSGRSSRGGPSSTRRWTASATRRSSGRWCSGSRATATSPVLAPWRCTASPPGRSCRTPRRAQRASACEPTSASPSAPTGWC
jgi:hypothetical protein